MLGSSVMRWTFGVRLVASTCLAGCLAGVASAQSHAPPDSSLLIVYEHDKPVAHERSVFVDMGDSLLVSATSTRDLLDEKGVRHPLKKVMLLVVDSRDLRLLRYESNQHFDGHVTVRGLLPGDTSIT